MSADRDVAPRFRRFRWIALLGLVAVLLAVAAERGVRAWLAHGSPSAGAEWIWVEGRLPRYTGPRAFYVYRDFELAEAAPATELRVAADEEYLVYLDGRRIGSNVYRPEVALDRYRVGDLLEPGRHRLAVELRSTRGAGGLLLALVDPETGETLLATDESWRAFDHYHPGVLEAWLPMSEGEPVISWGPPPTGRWGRVDLGPVRPRFDEVAGDLWTRRIQLPERRSSAAPGREGWEPVTVESAADPEPGPPAPVSRFDWGEEVTGYLVVEQKSALGLPVGLGYLDLEADLEPGVLPFMAMPADVEIVFLPGASLWRDVVPRRFRTLRLLGLSALQGVWVEPVPEEALAELPEAPPPVPPGVFGLRPPPLRTPVEDEVRRELERFPGVAGGEGF